MNETAETLSCEALLGEAADEFTLRLNQGERPDIEEYARRYPRIAVEIRQIFPALQLIQTSTGMRPEEGAAPAADASPGETGAWPSCQLGDYRIVREIGRGGMGVVYEAEQLSLRRRVALKVLPFAAVLDHKQLQRFRNEAQAAAHLHHTHIVPVFAVGCERGVHYYAMQYIEGHPLSAVIAELRRLCGLAGADGDDVSPAPGAPSRTLPSGRWASPGTSAAAAEVSPLRSQVSLPSSLSAQGSPRGRVFFRSAAQITIQAAEALQHAHDQGVIHRDIKPSNLLLDIQGELWVTDFGLALVQTDANLTMPGDLVGTIRYMSPEQALARRVLIDHRTDIYSLGVTLYELLTLEPVFRGGDRQELLRQIAFEDPIPPRRLCPSLPRELETVIGKAMAKRPDERYATAQDLADDLRRFIEDKPILAKPPTVLDRISKWARRHRQMVAAAAVLLVMAVIGLTVSTVLVARARVEAVAQRDEANVQRQQAEGARREAEAQRKLAVANFRLARDAVERMLIQVGDEALANVPGMVKVRRALLTDALEFYQQFLEVRSGDDAVRAEAGRAYRLVSRINALLGEIDHALVAQQQAVATFEALHAAHPDQVAYERNLAASLEELGSLQMHRGRLKDARNERERALVIRERLAALPSATDEDQESLGFCLLGAGAAIHRLNQSQQAEALYRRAIGLLEAQVAVRPDRPDLLTRLARAHNNLGILLHSSRTQEAEAAYRRAVALQERRVNAFAAEAVERERLALYLGNLGFLLHLGGSSTREPVTLRVFALREELAIELERLAQDFPGVPQYRELLAATHETAGRHLDVTSRFEEAQAAYRAALAQHEQLVQAYPGVVEYARGMVRIQVRLAHAYADLWQDDIAVAEFRKAVDLSERFARDFPDEPYFPSQMAYARHVISDRLYKIEAVELVRLSKGSVEGVREAVRRASLVEIDALPPKPFVLLVYGEFLLLSGQIDRGLAFVQRSVDLLTPEIWFHNSYYKSLGWALLLAGRPEEARAAMQQALPDPQRWQHDPPPLATPDDWTAAYFLDLVTRDQYVQRWADAVTFGSQHAACFPWFYIGQRMEIESSLDDARSAYAKCVELGRLPNAHHVSHWAAYRLSRLAANGVHSPDPATTAHSAPSAR